MKRFFTTLIAVLMLAIVCVSFTACEDIKTIKVSIDVYQGQSVATPKTYEIEIDLYRHLAPQTVDHIENLVNSGYYENTIVYKNGTESTEQLMLGDYVYNANGANGLKFSKNTKTKTYVKGEFEKAGVTGSDLLNEKYTVGLWRTFDANLSNFNGSATKLDVDSVYNSGSATLYMPTSTLTNYNGYFTVFGKITEETSKENFDEVVSALSTSDYFESYTIYWTGDKDNLTEHIMLTQTFNELKEEGAIADLFDPNEEGQLKEVGEYVVKPYFENTTKNVDSVLIKYASFFNTLSQITKVIVLGHSLSKIDLPYFMEVKEKTSPICEWYISYYDEGDKILKQMVIQMLRLNNAKLFKMDGSINEKDIERILSPHMT